MKLKNNLIMLLVLEISVLLIGCSTVFDNLFKDISSLFPKNHKPDCYGAIIPDSGEQCEK